MMVSPVRPVELYTLKVRACLGHHAMPDNNPQEREFKSPLYRYSIHSASRYVFIALNASQMLVIEWQL